MEEDNKSAVRVSVYGSAIVISSDINLEGKNITLSCDNESIQTKLKKVGEKLYTTDNILHPVLEKAILDWRIDEYSGEVEVEPSSITFNSSMTFFDSFGNLISVEGNYIYLYKSNWLKNPLSPSMEEKELTLTPESYKIYSLNNNKYIVFLFNEKNFQALLIDEDGNILQESASSFDEDVSQSTPEFDPWSKMIYYYREGKGIVDFKSSTFSYENPEKTSNIVLIKTAKNKTASIFVNESYIYQIVGYTGYIQLSKLKHNGSTVENLYKEGCYIYSAEPLGSMLLYKDYIIIPYISTSDKKIKFYLFRKDGKALGNLTTNFDDEFSLPPNEQVYLITDGINTLYILSYDEINQILTSYKIIEDNGLLKLEISNRKELSIPEFTSINIVNYENSYYYLSITTKDKTYILNFDLSYIPGNKLFSKPIYDFSDDYIIYSLGDKYVAKKQENTGLKTILYSLNSYYYETPPKISQIDYETYPSTGIDLTLECIDGNYEPLTFNFYIEYVQNGNLKEYSTTTTLSCVSKENLQIFIGSYSHLQNDVEKIMDSLGEYDETKDNIYY